MIKTLEKGSIQGDKNHFYLANLQGEFHMHLIYWQSNKADASFFKAAESQRPLLPNVCLAIFLNFFEISWHQQLAPEHPPNFG